jgi:hypothetical protein
MEDWEMQRVRHAYRHCDMPIDARLRLARIMSEAPPRAGPPPQRHALAHFRDLAGGLTRLQLATGLGVSQEEIRRAEETCCFNRRLLRNFACATCLPVYAARQLLANETGKWGTQWSGIIRAAENYRPIYPRPEPPKELVRAISACLEACVAHVEVR